MIDYDGAGAEAAMIKELGLLCTEKWLHQVLFTDSDEWTAWSAMGDPVLHIELRKWADVMLVAPLSANTLAKLTTGLCDNLLTCVARAWDNSKPVIICPSMNTFMWDNAHTAEAIAKVTAPPFSYILVKPISKVLACGDVGVGAMAEVNTIVQLCRQLTADQASSKL